MTDQTEQFNEVGHSSYALSILSNFKYELLDPTDRYYNHKLKLECSQSKISKLITHEDKFNIHKICGTIALINFTILFIDLCLGGFKGKTLYLKQNIYTIILTWIHGLLSMSSFQFLVPKSRTGILPMIWQEFRAHSATFALRSIIIANIIYFFGKNNLTDLCRLFIVLLTMYIADIISIYLRENNKESTTASMPYWTNLDPQTQKYIKLFYTHAQISATLSCLFLENTLYLMYLIFPIQIAAFLMTLVRKNIIKTKTYHVIYSLSLLSGYLVNISSIKLYIIIFTAYILYYIRVYIKVNKYYMWLLVFSLHNVNNQPMYLFISSVIYLLFKNNIIESSIRLESNTKVIENNEIFQDHFLIKIKTAELLDYKSGQYINLFFNELKRPYTPISIRTITSNNTKINEIEFLIKSYTNGIVSSKITKNYVIDSIIYYKGPFGTNYYSINDDSFYSNNKSIEKTNILMFSCGTGITPFYSMITNLKEDTKYKIYLYSSYKDKTQIYLYDRLEHGNLTKEIFLTENKLNDEKISKIFNNFDLLNTFVYICGTVNYNSMIGNIAKKKSFQYVFH